MQNILSEVQSSMDNAIEHLGNEFSKIQTGRANASILDGVRVDYYGTPTPLNQAATISVPEARQLIVKPFDKSIIGEMDKAIVKADLGFNPVNQGEYLLINIPQLTEERRKEIAKKAKSTSEDAKVAIRNVRKKGIDSLKKSKDLTEDDVKQGEKEIQNIVDKYNNKVEDLYDSKEKDLMTI